MTTKHDRDEDIHTAGLRGPFQRDDLLSRIARIREEHDVVLQVFDPSAVYSTRHLEAAAAKAMRAHRQDRALARDLAVEIACYAAGTTQIDRALELVGVGVQGEALALVVVGAQGEQAIDALLETAGLERDDTLLDQRDASVLERLGVPASMLDRVPEEDWELLVLERVALVDVEK